MHATDVTNHVSKKELQSKYRLAITLRSKKKLDIDISNKEKVQYLRAIFLMRLTKCKVYRFSKNVIGCSSRFNISCKKNVINFPHFSCRVRKFRKPCVTISRKSVGHGVTWKCKVILGQN